MKLRHAKEYQQFIQQHQRATHELCSRRITRDVLEQSLSDRLMIWKTKTDPTGVFYDAKINDTLEATVEVEEKEYNPFLMEIESIDQQAEVTLRFTKRKDQLDRLVLKDVSKGFNLTYMNETTMQLTVTNQENHTIKSEIENSNDPTLFDLTWEPISFEVDKIVI